MSDIDIHFYGVIALFVFLISIAGLFLSGLACLVIAFIKCRKSNQKTTCHPAFAFCLATVPLIVVNVVAFGILVYFINSNSDETNLFLDKFAVFAWLPLQLVIWFIAGKIIRKFQLKLDK